MKKIKPEAEKRQTERTPEALSRYRRASQKGAKTRKKMKASRPTESPD